MSKESERTSVMITNVADLGHLIRLMARLNGADIILRFGVNTWQDLADKLADLVDIIDDVSEREHEENRHTAIVSSSEPRKNMPPRPRTATVASPIITARPTMTVANTPPFVPVEPYFVGPETMYTVKSAAPCAQWITQEQEQGLTTYKAATPVSVISAVPDHLNHDVVRTHAHGPFRPPEIQAGERYFIGPETWDTAKPADVAIAALSSDPLLSTSSLPRSLPIFMSPGHVHVSSAPRSTSSPTTTTLRPTPSPQSIHGPTEGKGTLQKPGQEKQQQKQPAWATIWAPPPPGCLSDVSSYSCSVGQTQTQAMHATQTRQITDLLAGLSLGQ